MALQRMLDAAERYFEINMEYVVRGGFWISVGQGVSIATSFILAYAFANYLPQDTYGTYKYILAVLGIAAIATLPGLNMAVLQAVARGFRGSVVPVLLMKIRWGFIGGLSLAATGAYYYFIGGNEVLGVGFFAAAVFVPFVDSLSIYTAVLSGQKKFREGAIESVVIALITTTSILAAVFFTQSAAMLVLAYCASYVVGRSLAFYWTERHTGRTEPLAPETYAFGKHLSAIGVLTAFSAYIDSILIWHMLGAQAVAVYAFALSAITPAKTFLKSIINLAHPKFAVADSALLQQTLVPKVFRALALSVPFAIIFILIVPYLYQLFFPQYLASIPYTQVLALSFLLFPEKIFGIAITAREDKSSLYTMNIVNPIIKLVLMLMMIPLFGIWGAVIAMLMHQCSAVIMSTYFFLRKLPDTSSAA